MSRADREALVKFVLELSHGYPNATVADTLLLLFTARRLKACPSEAQELVDTLKKEAPRFEVMAAAGRLMVNLGPAPLPSWAAEWIPVVTQ